MGWEELDVLESRGKRSDKAASLGGLHDKRKETLSQFFTPAWVVDFIWQTIRPAFRAGHNYSILDNSVGSASMFRGADARVHKLSGFDIDDELIPHVSRELERLGFETDIKQGALENVELGQYSVGLINPPFSVTIGGRSLKRFEGVTAYGKFGPHSSALSHKYALMQALEHCDIVCALLPKSFCDEVKGLSGLPDRLVARYRLPVETFRAESVESVATELLIFGRPGTSPSQVDERVIGPQSLPSLNLGLRCRSLSCLGWTPIRDSDRPSHTIKHRPSSDKRVILKKASRQVYLQFFDGVTEARVLNRIFEKRLSSEDGYRLPRNTKYAGQYKLSIDVLLLQDEPFKALGELCDLISEEGGEPVVTLQLRRSLKRAIREHRMQTTPFGKVVYRTTSRDVSAKAKVIALLNPQDWRSRVAIGEVVRCERSSDGWVITTARGQFTCPEDTFEETFEVADGGTGGHWEAVHPPLKTRFPSELKEIERQAKALSIDTWLSWDFQLEDLCELALKPKGAICGWEMALGKARLALALALIKSGPSLLVVKSRLVGELMIEIKGLGLDESQFQEIKCPSHVRELKKINVISYDRLKRPWNMSFPKLTPAKMLRKRISTLIADEGGLLSNIHSEQTKAVWDVQASSRYVFDGTPCPNYPREMLTLAAWTVGEGRSYQPYSRQEGFIAKDLWSSAEGQKSGRDVFTERFICYEWATNEFLDSGKGAKREVPKIKYENVGTYRLWVDSFVKRRVQQEPAVQAYVRFPVPTLHEPISLDWDFDHLLSYVQTAEEFSSWYRRYKDEQQGKNKSLNLALILARLEACFKAANTPSLLRGCAEPYKSLTSKERACLDLIELQIKEGNRPLVFARNPLTLQRLSVELESRGIDHIVFTGQDTIKARNKLLMRRVRSDCTQAMLASLGVTQDGLNLPQFNRCIFYDRSYKARDEYQGIFRLIRPQQKSDVEVYFLHLKGSIDEYQGQLVRWKLMASRAGLDYGNQPEDEDFAHFEVFIARFIESVPVLRGKLIDLRRRA